jgi:hypothetical protein
MMPLAWNAFLVDFRMLLSSFSMSLQGPVPPGSFLPPPVPQSLGQTQPPLTDLLKEFASKLAASSWKPTLDQSLATVTALGTLAAHEPSVSKAMRSYSWEYHRLYQPFTDSLGTMASSQLLQLLTSFLRLRARPSKNLMDGIQKVTVDRMGFRSWPCRTLLHAWNHRLFGCSVVPCVLSLKTITAVLAI